MPESFPRLSLVRAADTVPHEYGGRLANRHQRRIRGVLGVAARFVVGGSMSYALGGVVGAVIGLMAVVLVSAAVAVLLSAMLGRRDSHSPFTRIMLIICAIAARQPGDYGLVPTSAQAVSSASAGPRRRRCHTLVAGEAIEVAGRDREAGN